MDPPAELIGLASFRVIKKPTRQTWIMGEHHIFDQALANDKRHAGNALRHIFDTTKEPIYVYLELAPDAVATARRSLHMFPHDIQRILNNDLGHHPSTIRRCLAMELLGATPNAFFIHCDMRNQPPFSTMLLLYDVDKYEDLHRGVLEARYPLPAARRAFLHDLVRRLEHAFVTHVTNTATTMTFWWSMVHPNIPEPKWYADIVAEVFPNAINPIKQQLSALYVRHPAKFHRILALFKNVMETWLSYHSRHTRVLSKMKRRGARNAAARVTPAIIRDKTTIGQYFGIMMLLIQDVYMAAMYGLNAHRAKNHVFVVGNLHATFLSKLLMGGNNEYHAWKSDTLHIRVSQDTKQQRFDDDFTPTEHVVAAYLAQASA
jgi:hypothetical protein